MIFFLKKYSQYIILEKKMCYSLSEKSQMAAAVFELERNIPYKFFALIYNFIYKLIVIYYLLKNLG